MLFVYLNKYIYLCALRLLQHPHFIFVVKYFFCSILRIFLIVCLRGILINRPFILGESIVILGNSLLEEDLKTKIFWSSTIVMIGSTYDHNTPFTSTRTLQRLSTYTV